MFGVGLNSQILFGIEKITNGFLMHDANHRSKNLFFMNFGQVLTATHEKYSTRMFFEYIVSFNCHGVLRSDDVIPIK